MELTTDLEKYRKGNRRYIYDLTTGALSNEQRKLVEDKMKRYSNNLQ